MSSPASAISGTSLAAGVVVLAGLVTFAAQALLGNVIAGLQIAFSRELRLDDVVVVEGEWGRIQEMKLTYVVLHIWDDRQLVLPNCYFTTQPFQNWTRDLASLVGTVELDLDWSAPVEQMRAELATILADGNGWWDGRVGKLRVTEGLHGLMRVRAEVSAGDANDMWELRCHVRERLTRWLWEQHRGALPRLHPRPCHNETDGEPPDRRTT